MTKGNKKRNAGTMTEAAFKSFIISALRKASMYWKPKTQCIKDANVSRGKYKCEGCGKIVPATLPPKPGNKRRQKNILADHRTPIVDPKKGFEGFDKWIERCFIEREGYQALCKKCHDEKTYEEKLLSIKEKKEGKL